MAELSRMLLHTVWCSRRLTVSPCHAQACAGVAALEAVDSSAAAQVRTHVRADGGPCACADSVLAQEALCLCWLRRPLCLCWLSHVFSRHSRTRPVTCALPLCSFPTLPRVAVLLGRNHYPGHMLQSAGRSLPGRANAAVRVYQGARPHRLGESPPVHEPNTEDVAACATRWWHRPHPRMRLPP
eukprot:739344-Prymnesium_polylepis.1